MLLGKGAYGHTAWHLAAWHGYKEVLEKLWDWGTELQLKLKSVFFFFFLLSRDDFGQSAWHLGADTYIYIHRSIICTSQIERGIHHERS